MFFLALALLAMEEIFRLLPVLDLLLEAPCRLSLALDLVAVVALFQ